MNISGIAISRTITNKDPQLKPQAGCVWLTPHARRVLHYVKANAFNAPHEETYEIV